MEHHKQKAFCLFTESLQKVILIIIELLTIACAAQVIVSFFKIVHQNMP
jgi:TRAP-type C4-dicarboxylate transport system permease small subunit